MRYRYYEECRRCSGKVVFDDDVGIVCEQCGVVAVGDYWFVVPEEDFSEFEPRS
jgi:hypothetical protein